MLSKHLVTFYCKGFILYFNLGKGNIPKAELEYVIKNCKSDIIVETPGGLEAQKKDIALRKKRG